MAIYSEVSDLEWATPVLYLRSPDARIFAPAAVAAVVTSAATPVTVTIDTTARPLITDTARSATTPLAAVTLTTIFLGAGMAAWAAAHLTFNLVSLRTASSLIPNIAPLASIIAAAISGITYVLTGNGSSLIGRVGRWLALGVDGRPRLDRMAIGAVVAVVSILIVVTTPTLSVTEFAGDLDAQTGWKWIDATAEGVPENVYREASWYVGPGHRNDALRLELRIEPYDSVMFGRVLAPATLLNDAVQLPRPASRTPLLVQSLAASWPWARGRLRFKIVRDSAVEETPEYVQVDTRIVDQAGTVLAQQCRRLPTRWSAVPVAAGSDHCPPIR